MRKPKVDYTQFKDLSVLSNREKEIFKMRQEGKDIKEISEICGIKIESVYCMLTKCLKKLKGEFDYKKQVEYTKTSLARRVEREPEYKEKLKKYNKEYYEENKEQKKEYSRKYYEENKERLKEYK